MHLFFSSSFFLSFLCFVLRVRALFHLMSDLSLFEFLNSWIFVLIFFLVCLFVLQYFLSLNERRKMHCTAFKLPQSAYDVRHMSSYSFESFQSSPSIRNYSLCSKFGETCFLFMLFIHSFILFSSLSGAFQINLHHINNRASILVIVATARRFSLSFVAIHRDFWAVNGSHSVTSSPITMTNNLRIKCLRFFCCCCWKHSICTLCCTKRQPTTENREKHQNDVLKRSFFLNDNRLVKAMHSTWHIVDQASHPGSFTVYFTILSLNLITLIFFWFRSEEEEKKLWLIVSHTLFISTYRYILVQ